MFKIQPCACADTVDAIARGESVHSVDLGGSVFGGVVAVPLRDELKVLKDNPEDFEAESQAVKEEYLQ